MHVVSCFEYMPDLHPFFSAEGGVRNDKRILLLTSPIRGWWRRKWRRRIPRKRKGRGFFTKEYKRISISRRYEVSTKP